MTERDRLVEEKFATDDKVRELMDKVSSLQASGKLMSPTALTTILTLCKASPEGGALAVKGERFRDLFELAEDRTILAFHVEKGSGTFGLSVMQKEGILPNEVPGVYVKVVQPDSAADEAGIEQGDQLLEVDGTSLIGASKVQFGTSLFL